ncbi:hypothetical protein [Micromonospora sp. RP3T]|uniref:hypothetical protein n=1 Tax=Micromonospora sp. RP3T TaxID=2135446 RepID=UPI000D161E5B|nr:hypothetical protein [Micromonospora sp. RP3T]PTA46443.1 hypothetical protein C8054_10310 [Micromonospora sp. RP3T]
MITEPSPAPESMRMRRSALDRMAVSGTAVKLPAFTDITVRISGYGGDVTAPELVSAVVDRLLRPAERPAAGAAVVDGLPMADVAEGRRLHRFLFSAVWEKFVTRCDELSSSATPIVKESVTRDGVIPPEQYGSRWSFKALHTDRDAMLFSHLYGPVRGFVGGEFLLVDARALMQARELSFDDAFEWSVEPTPGSKPVLRAEYGDAATREFGINLGAPAPGQVFFVNNTYGAGILHGVTPVIADDPGRMVREYHRCSAR